MSFYGLERVEEKEDVDMSYNMDESNMQIENNTIQSYNRFKE